MQKHQSDYLRQKNTDFDKCRQTVTKLMSSLVGFIQFKEQSLMNTLDRAELAVVTSLNNIVNQLDGFVNVSALFDDVCVRNRIIWVSFILPFRFRRKIVVSRWKKMSNSNTFFFNLLILFQYYWPGPTLIDNILFTYG